MVLKATLPLEKGCGGATLIMSECGRELHAHFYNAARDITSNSDYGNCSKISNTKKERSP